MAQIDFWYEFASTYSYLSAMRIDELARERGIEVRWRSFLLGPTFQSQGWNTSPFNIYEAKGRHMVRDMERICAARDLPFAMPEPFPQNGLAASRLALLGENDGWTPDFTRAVYGAEFGERKDISDPAMLAEILASLGLDADTLLAETQNQEVKDRLKAQTAESQALGVFGAPTFVVGDELFWGDDRLEQALDWAVARPGG